METLWFCLIGFMLATYVVLDGFDLGVGVLHLFVARTEEERELVLRTIGPVWDGNEVWLLASGGAIVLAFPTLYATSFSGFYLPLMMVLWLLMGRALGVEMHHLRADGRFFLPLWTDFRVGEQTGILDWYTILVGLAAVAALAYHAALWLLWRTDSEVRRRITKIIPILFVLVLVLWIGTIAASISVQPLLTQNFHARPWGAVFPIASFLAIFVSFSLHRRHMAGPAFLTSALSLYAMICSAAAGLYPYVLPASNPQHGLTIYRAASASESMTLALLWWIPGMVLVGIYTYFVYGKILPTRLSLPHEEH